MPEGNPDNPPESDGKERLLFEDDLIGLYEKFVITRGETSDLMALLAQEPEKAFEHLQRVYAVRDELRQYLARLPAGHQFWYYLNGLMPQFNTDVQRAGIVHDLRFEYFGVNHYRYPEDQLVETHLVPLAECTQEFGVLFRALFAIREDR